MARFMTVEGTSFLKKDLKRIEWYPSGTFLYIIIAGRKDPLCIKCENSQKAEETRANLMAEADA